MFNPSFESNISWDLQALFDHDAILKYCMSLFLDLGSEFLDFAFEFLDFAFEFLSLGFKILSRCCEPLD